VFGAVLLVNGWFGATTDEEDTEHPVTIPNEDGCKTVGP
jgi:hypothetical protein